MCVNILMINLRQPTVSEFQVFKAKTIFQKVVIIVFFFFLALAVISSLNHDRCTRVLWTEHWRALPLTIDLAPSWTQAFPLTWPLPGSPVSLGLDSKDRWQPVRILFYFQQRINFYCLIYQCIILDWTKSKLWNLNRVEAA